MRNEASVFFICVAVVLTVIILIGSFSGEIDHQDRMNDLEYYQKVKDLKSTYEMEMTLRRFDSTLAHADSVILNIR